ncbi:YdaU family protein [Chromobacterium vaccinii]|uniref:YdaU family protein n=1 Tax=Chromobacterium vaccinii TaxID=1108595 RepID=UPI003C70FF35
MSRPAKEKRADIWMPLYIADYLADTSHLSTEEHGAYLLLLMNAWTNEGALPANEERLRRITRMDRTAWEVSWPELKTFFYEEGDQLRHHRLDAEIDRAKANVKQRSDAGKASAEKRKLEREAQRRAKELANENSTGVATSVETDDATDLERDAQRNGRPSPSPTPTTTDTSVSSVVSESARDRDGPPGSTSAPADLTPTLQHRGIASNMRLDLDNELAMFLANAKSKGKLSADWNAEFELWLRRSRNFGNGKDQQPKPITTNHDQRAAAMDTIGVGQQYLTGGKHAALAS